MAEGEDDPRTTGEMKWGDSGEDDLVLLVIREEAATAGPTSGMRVKGIGYHIN